MSVVVEFTIDAEQFQLGQLFAGIPDVRIEVADFVPIGTELIPYLWVDGDPETIATVESTLADDARVGDLVLATTHETRHLYRIDWTTDINDLFACITGSELVVDHAVGTGREWYFRVFSAEHADLTTFHRTLVEHGLSVTILRVHDPAPLDDDTSVELTTEQREALTAAFRSGYFEIPRQVTLEDLAGDLDISRQAVAHRLQRGVKVLVEALVIEDPLVGDQGTFHSAKTDG